MSTPKPLVRMLCAASVAALAITGCTSPKETSADNATDTLEVMSWWTSASEAPAFKVFIDAFTKANSGVTVTNAAVAGGAGSQARVDLAKRLLDGNPPDVWQTFDGAATAAFVRSKQVRDISSVFSGISENMNPTILKAVTVSGKQYAMPTGAHRSNVLFFNKDVLSKAGVTAPAQGYTRQAFLADLKKVKDSGATALCLGGKDSFTTAELFENVLLANIGTDGWQKVQDDKLDWGGKSVKAALTEFDTVLGYADPDADNQSWDQAVAKLAKGECAYLTMNDSAYGEVVKAGGTDATVGEVAFPGTDGSYLAVVDVFVAATTAKNAKNALAFLKTLADPTANLEFNKIKGSVPVLKNVDVASLSTYQQAASKALWAGPVVPSIVHGEAMPPAFTQGFFDGVSTYVRTRDASAFLTKMSEAVNSYQPAGH
ncbi:MAG: ABC transporter substrate-binding protein [Tetrasphaera sp.]